jgi:hypothetical protein
MLDSASLPEGAIGHATVIALIACAIWLGVASVRALERRVVSEHPSTSPTTCARARC